MSLLIVGPVLLLRTIAVMKRNEDSRSGLQLSDWVSSWAKAVAGYLVVAGLGYWLVIIAFAAFLTTMNAFDKGLFERPEGSVLADRIFIGLTMVLFAIALGFAWRILPEKSKSSVNDQFDQ
ncbi:MAG: hypothetical protein IPO12_02150 [Flavobacteriales bacterium]|nr:hypothetical protein [Flavobacteriales bacterium]MBK9537548.1 hypothetical protein [Flavobacteriales bacterium]